MVFIIQFMFSLISMFAIILDKSLIFIKENQYSASLFNLNYNIYPAYCRIKFCHISLLKTYNKTVNYYLI